LRTPQLIPQGIYYNNFRLKVGCTVGLEPLEIFQSVLKSDAGNDRDTQKIKFGNTNDVTSTGRVHAICAKIVS